MKRVTVNASKSYDIIIDKGILKRSGELSSQVIKPCSAAILTDSNVASLYLDTLEESLKPMQRTATRSGGCPYMSSMW